MKSFNVDSSIQKVQEKRNTAVYRTVVKIRRGKMVFGTIFVQKKKNSYIQTNKPTNKFVFQIIENTRADRHNLRIKGNLTVYSGKIFRRIYSYSYVIFFYCVLANSLNYIFMNFQSPKKMHIKQYFCKL